MWDAGAIAIVITFIFGVILSIIGYLLHSKNEHRDKKLEALEEELKFVKEDCDRKHDEDVKQLNNLELQLAKFYYQKADITLLFSEFKNYLNERFDRIETAIGLDRKKHDNS